MGNIDIMTLIAREAVERWTCRDVNAFMSASRTTCEATKFALVQVAKQKIRTLAVTSTVLGGMCTTIGRICFRGTPKYLIPYVRVANVTVTHLSEIRARLAALPPGVQSVRLTLLRVNEGGCLSVGVGDISTQVWACELNRLEQLSDLEIRVSDSGAPDIIRGLLDYGKAALARIERLKVEGIDSGRGLQTHNGISADDLHAPRLVRLELPTCIAHIDELAQIRRSHPAIRDMVFYNVIIPPGGHGDVPANRIVDCRATLELRLWRIEAQVRIKMALLLALQGIELTN